MSNCENELSKTAEIQLCISSFTVNDIRISTRPASDILALSMAISTWIFMPESDPSDKGAPDTIGAARCTRWLSSLGFYHCECCGCEQRDMVSEYFGVMSQFCLSNSEKVNLDDSRILHCVRSRDAEFDSLSHDPTWPPLSVLPIRISS
jgi:hypothetical protein